MLSDIDARRPKAPAQLGGTDLLSDYYVRVSAHPVPGASEERRLTRHVRHGRDASDRIGRGPELDGDVALAVRGRRAHDELLHRNLRLVISVAKRYPTSERVDLADLIQEGNIALSHAIRKYDERRGFRLSTYAVKWSRQGISRALDKQTSSVKVPVETARELRATLRSVGGDVAALPESLRGVGAACFARSLDARAGGGTGTAPAAGPLAASAPSFEEATIERQALDAGVRAALQRLDDEARQAIVRRFGLDGAAPGSLAVIGRELCCGRTRVRALLDDAMRIAEEELMNHVLEGVPDTRSAPSATASWSRRRRIDERIDACGDVSSGL